MLMGRGLRRRIWCWRMGLRMLLVRYVLSVSLFSHWVVGVRYWSSLDVLTSMDLVGLDGTAPCCDEWCWSCGA